MIWENQKFLLANSEKITEAAIPTFNESIPGFVLPAAGIIIFSFI
jgi:hypothetical protein